MSWHNHSTWPRLDMSGLPWTSDHLAFFVNTIVIVRRIIKVHIISYNYAFSLIRKWLSSKLQKNEKKIFTCLASSNSGSLTESARYSTFFSKEIFYHHLFKGYILNNTKKVSNFLFLIGRAAEEWKAGKTWIQSVNIYQVIPATNISIDRSKTTSSSSLTFLRQPTRLFILFRCSFSPVPSVPARMPTLWGDLIIWIFAW